VAALTIVILIAAGFSLFAWVASLLSGDYSWVDRLWSIVPVIYTWVFAVAAGLHDTRLDVMAVLATVWGARLSYNFARKGGYSGVQDYRWPVLRARMSAAEFQLFNLFFIVLVQNALLVLIALPALTASQHRATDFGALDLLLTMAFLACTLGETIADQQQWDFQTWKHREISEGRSPEPRFVQSGLFSSSRHPNYFFELAQWWLFFFFGAVAAGTLLVWTVAGPILLSILFVGSTRFTEQISLSRYPEYAQYQERTSAVVPWFPRKAKASVSRS
jgi:steroid 5-alpha reductase family enzyme